MALVFGKLNTYHVLQKRNAYLAISPNWCLLCKMDCENLDHLFLHCSLAVELFIQVFKEFGLSLAWPRRCEAMLWLDGGLHIPKGV